MSKQLNPCSFCGGDRVKFVITAWFYGILAFTISLLLMAIYKIYLMFSS